MTAPTAVPSQWRTGFNASNRQGFQKPVEGEGRDPDTAWNLIDVRDSLMHCKNFTRKNLKVPAILAMALDVFLREITRFHR